jgi:hypothetical protein
VSTKEIYRKAHEDACIGLNVNSAPTAAGTDEEVASSQNLSYEEANDTHDEIDDMDAWTPEFTNDDVFNDHETATTEEYYENVHDDVANVWHQTPKLGRHIYLVV